MFSLFKVDNIYNIIFSSVYMMLIFYASDIVDIEKPHGICSRTFVLDEFSV